MQEKRYLFGRFCVKEPHQSENKMSKSATSIVAVVFFAKGIEAWSGCANECLRSYASSDDSEISTSPHVRGSESS